MNVLIATIEGASHPVPPFVAIQADHIRRHGHQVTVFSFGGRRNPRRYLRARTELGRLASKTDIIHAHHGQTGIAALGIGPPVVLTIHGSDVLGVFGPGGRQRIATLVLSTISRVAAVLADEVIAVSPRLAKQLWRPCHVIPGGVDLDLFQPTDLAHARRALQLPQGKLLVLLAGLPNRRALKRIDLAESVVARLSKQAELVIPQAVPHAQMPLYLNACDALLVTSEQEASPTIVKEALACNLPVVSFDVGDVAERLRDIEGCYVIPDRSLDAMVSALGRVLAKRQRIAGRQAVLSLSESKVAARVLGVYEHALNKSRQGSRAV